MSLPPPPPLPATPVALGIDLVELPRFARSAAQEGFLARLCAPAELAALPAAAEPRAVAAATLFAAKEAVLKALGTGAWQEGTGFGEVVVHRGAAGASVRLEGAARRRWRALGGGPLLLELGVDGDEAWARCYLLPG